MASPAPKIHLHQRDLPAGLSFGNEIAVDTELRGLHIQRDRVCLVQLKDRTGDVHLVKIYKDQREAPNLKKLLEDKARLKIFHFGRHDMASLQHWLDIVCTPVFCTKIASKLVRTYGDRHGLKDLVREAVGIDISKQQQLTDWGQETLTQEQMEYAAGDVLYLHALMDYMKALLTREDLMPIAQGCFDFLPVRADLDQRGWPEDDIFAHS